MSRSRRRPTLALRRVQFAVGQQDRRQLVEGAALEAGVAHPTGQLDGAFGQVGRQRIGVGFVGGDQEVGGLDVEIVARQRPGLARAGPPSRRVEAARTWCPVTV